MIELGESRNDSRVLSQETRSAGWNRPGMDAIPDITLPRALGFMIHPSALVDPAAVLGREVRIGPFCIVGPDVTLEDGVELVSHVVVDGHTRIGAGAILFPFCTV